MADQASQQAKAIWALGRYDNIAARLEPAADELCEVAGIGPGTRVLDVGAGTGNVALAAARRGASVVATDIAPAMVAAGRARTDGLEVTWQEADARELPFDPGSFDAVLSCFGAIFAPEPERTAAELLRVTARGGVVALTAWPQGGSQTAAFAVLSRYLPAPSTPWSWGAPEVARGRLEPHAAAVDVLERELHWRFPGGLEAWLEHFEQDAPPIAAARRALGERWPPVRAALAEAIGAHGALDGDGAFVTRPRYLVVRARARDA